MNEALVRSVVAKSKRTLDTVHDQFTLRETNRRQKITTGDALFGEHDLYEKHTLDAHAHLLRTSSSTKRARTDETGDEPATDPTSFEAQAAAKKKAAIRTVGTVTPVDDFKVLVEQGSPSFTDVCKQLCTLILELINNSRGDSLFEKALQCLQCLRDACIAKLEPKIFNDFAVLLKRLAAEPDGRKDFWKKIVSGSSARRETADEFAFVRRANQSDHQW